MFLMHLAFEGEVLLPAPSWVSYKPQSIIAKNNYHWIQTSAQNNWFPKAQEIEKILPEVVTDGEKYKSVSYGNIVGVLHFLLNRILLSNILFFFAVLCLS